MLARTVMVESGLGGQFWFKDAAAEEDACFVVYKQHIKTSPHQAMYGELKDVSKSRTFRCKAFICLNKEHLERGKHTARAIDVINLGFAPNTSTSALYLPDRKTQITITKFRSTKMNFLFRRGR
jgi:hypothetical protein